MCAFFLDDVEFEIDLEYWAIEYFLLPVVSLDYCGLATGYLLFIFYNVASTSYLILLRTTTLL